MWEDALMYMEAALEVRLRLNKKRKVLSQARIRRLTLLLHNVKELLHEMYGGEKR